jgi:hypothetical protein
VEPRPKIMMIVVITGHECIGETFWGTVGGRRRKGEKTEG